MSRHITIGVVCLLLSGPSSVRGQAPGPSNNVAQAQNQISTPANEKGAAALERWRSCVRRVHADDSYSISELQAQIKRPQDISQMLQELKLAWENDWLLQPEFYDEAILLNFFNGVAVTWKERKHDLSGVEAIDVETDSRVFPQMPVVLEAFCSSWSRQLAPHGQRTLLSIGGSIRIYGRPVPELTLQVIREVLGPETKNTIDLAFASNGSDGTPVTTKGSVVYANPAKEKIEGTRMGLSFWFSIPPKPAATPEREIAADDVVQAIVLNAQRHQVIEN
jgi:hypothetical protein